MATTSCLFAEQTHRQRRRATAALCCGAALAAGGTLLLLATQRPHPGSSRPSWPSLAA
ncbi:hypothetical protein [Nonomuraea sp. NPDC050202]|uniref:hypothetical protein n=1 Tax=Nonomuraea sp. NPDC050202 TaxID=3155035 RepID=UPI0033E28E7E